MKMANFITSARVLTLAAGVCLTAGAHAQPTPAPATLKPSKPAKVASKPGRPVAAPELEAKAMVIVKAMSDRLAQARSMSFTAVVTYESPSRIGPPCRIPRSLK